MTCNTIYHIDCMEFMKHVDDDSFDLTLTDIPYGVVNRESNGLRSLDKQDADRVTFELAVFLPDIYRVTKSTVIIFCGREQLSEVYRFFAGKQAEGHGTVRQLVWQKSNPSPMNGQFVYLSGIENAVWFKKRGGTFNARCKNTVFRYPRGRSRVHPTEKNHELLRELILDNSNEGDLVFDPCCGSGAHLLVANQLGRLYVGCETDDVWYDTAKRRLAS